MVSKHIEYVLVTDVVEVTSPFFLDIKIKLQEGKRSTNGKERKEK